MQNKEFTNSHDYAHAMKLVADFLLSKPAFNLPDYEDGFSAKLYYYADKAGFLAAARALGGVKNVTDERYFCLTNKLPRSQFSISAERSAVCRLIEPAKPAMYDCEPLLSQTEEQELSHAE